MRWGLREDIDLTCWRAGAEVEEHEDRQMEREGVRYYFLSLISRLYSAQLFAGSGGGSAAASLSLHNTGGRSAGNLLSVSTAQRFHG